MTHELPELPYAYDALEPFIDARTMEIHYGKHHAGYVKKLNAALANNPELQKRPVEELLKELTKIPENIRQSVINTGGGVANHTFFWNVLKKDIQLTGPIAEAINKDFGSFEEFKQHFTKSAITLFGSGWTWLVLNEGKLEITNTLNQESPLSSGKKPLLCLDVWEHAYYLKYQNKRVEYVENFFAFVNWEKVNDNFQ